MKTVVTIGMCLHNSENFLRGAIASIIKQDFPHEQIQVIFVGDGSEDHTLEIIRVYASRMDIKTKAFHTSWQGLGSARNLWSTTLMAST